MTNCLKALVFSLFAHGLAAVALAFWFSHIPSVELPRLDLSAVELSFAEEEREAPAVLPPPPESETTPQKPEPKPPPPEPQPEPPPLEPKPEPPPPEPEPEPEPEPPPPDPEPEPPPPDPEPHPILPRDDPISREPEPPPLEPEPPPILPREDPISREPAPPPQAPKQAQINAQPRPLKSIRPDYPVAARKRGAEGEVTLELEINEKGRVTSVKVVESCGHDDLDAAAVRAATKAHFVPAKAGNNAVSSVARITISFRLTSQ